MNRYDNVYIPVLTLQRAPVNHGGLCSVKIFKWEDVLAWPDINPETGVMDAAVSMKPGKVVYSCPLIDEASSFVEEEGESKDGDFFKISVRCGIPGSNASNKVSLQAMRYHRWGVIAEDRDGVARLLGNPDGGAKLLINYGSGEGNSSRKTELQFIWIHSQQAPIYTAQAFQIIIGGLILIAGCLKLVQRFRVGDVGAPMNDGDDTLTNILFANKNCLVLADGTALPVDDGTGAIDWSGSISRHMEKTLAGNTITFVGNVVDKEIIEVYAWT